jgi:hypothetical protein
VEEKAEGLSIPQQFVRRMDREAFQAALLEAPSWPQGDLEDAIPHVLRACPKGSRMQGVCDGWKAGGGSLCHSFVI